MDENAGEIADTGATSAQDKFDPAIRPPVSLRDTTPVTTKRSDQNPRRTSSIADLPPDRQAEIASSRAHHSAKRKHVYRPQLPSVVEAVELHSNEIHLAFIRCFEPCNQYAIAIDTVARERLTDRIEFNRYLQEFDAAIEEFGGKINTLYASHEEMSAGSKTTNRASVRIEANIQTRRSLQLLRLFKNADDIVRMVQFLNIYNDLEDRKAIGVIDSVINAINRCCRALRKVKVACFRRIIEAEQLVMPNSDETTIADLHAARRIARIGSGSRRRPASGRRTSKAMIDPGAPALLPVGNEVGPPSGDPGGQKEVVVKRIRSRPASEPNGVSSSVSPQSNDAPPQ